MASKKSKWRIVGYVFKLLLALFIVAAGYGYYVYDTALKPSTPYSTPVSFAVEENMTADDVVAKLYREKLISNELVTKIYMRLHKKTNMYVGNFSLDANMSTKEIINIQLCTFINSGTNRIALDGNCLILRCHKMIH